jgi:hypothetical protein
MVAVFAESSALPLKLTVGLLAVVPSTVTALRLVLTVPVIASVPSATWVGPVYVSKAERVSVPAPLLINPPSRVLPSAGSCPRTWAMVTSKPLLSTFAPPACTLAAVKPCRKEEVELPAQSVPPLKLRIPLPPVLVMLEACKTPLPLSV